MPARTAALLLILSYSLPVPAGEPPARHLSDGLRPFVEAASGTVESFELSGRVTLPVEGDPQSVRLLLRRFDDESFDLVLEHAEYAVSVRRRAEATAFALPHHNVVYLAAAAPDATSDRPVNTKHSLAPEGITKRLLSAGSTISGPVQLLLNADTPTVTGLLSGVFGLRFDSASRKWTTGDDVTFHFDDEGVIHLSIHTARVELAVRHTVPAQRPAGEWPGYRRESIERRELERQLVLGVRRSLEILAPSRLLTTPLPTPRRVEHGELRWIEGQRVAILEGTPEQIGRAHGELLKQEIHRCTDSVLYAFGTVQTIRTGRWFRHDLEAAWERLEPHIPARHKRETRSMAAASGLDPQTAQVLNIFPELFHCSGFAVFGNATKSGKLYHGRVLDYMTTIGLQDAATTFIVKPQGLIPFANVGYAGFIGSVSGMNAEAISLGEMGGGGEGQWDGVPMATLMRRALEECSTLDDVMSLWKNSPRTCEYYYVFADGKQNRAVGVSAFPDSIEFVFPGESHPRLGPGIEDTVVLSAGSRLETLRHRITSRHGKIDVEAALWLMSRPVAMQSNLHNVLFVPEDGLLYVANADHNHPAAERPYVKLSLKQLLTGLDTPDKKLFRRLGQ